MFDASFYLSSRGLPNPCHVFPNPPTTFHLLVPRHPYLLSRNLTSQIPHVRCCIMINAVHSHNPSSPPTLSSYATPFIHLPVAFTCSVDCTSSSLSHWIPSFLFSIACGTGAKILGKGKWYGSFVLTCRTVYLAFVLRCAFEYFNVMSCFLM